MATAKKAKKKTARTATPGGLGRRTQSVFKGKDFPKQPPKELLDARDKFLTAKRAQAKAASKKGEYEQELIGLMHKHQITRIEMDGEGKFFEIQAPEKIAIKTVPKDQREAREDAENGQA